MNEINRRNVLKTMSAGVLSAAGSRAAGARTQSSAGPGSGEIDVRVTAGTQRFAQGAPLKWGPPSATAADAIRLDADSWYQEILGFGAALTDSACYMLNQLPSDARAKLMRELFDPSQMGMGVCRLCIGSSDYATKVYSYDEGGPDPDLARFSIDHDREYILPVVSAARAVNPDLFLFASPWSPPAWMKVNNSMLGGLMEKKHFPAYASYFVKFLEAYESAGVKVDAITIQNEVDTDQDGRMPASLWGQEYETQFVAEHLGPAIANAKLDTKVWIIDHNYNLWGRAIAELDEPDVNKYVDGVAWHGYLGHPSAMSRVHEAHPEKHMYWTEGGPAYNAPNYATDCANWAATYAGILHNWARCIVGWNMALDQNGKPNIGPFDCGGVVTVDSRTKEVSRSGQYWAFVHYCHAARTGARRIDSAGMIEGVSHVAFANRDGSTAVVLTNKGGEKRVVLRLSGREATVPLPADSVTNLSWA